MFYKRPSLRMGGMPTGIDSLTPRVQAQEGFLGNRDMFFLPSNLKNLQKQRFDVGTSGGVITKDARKMKSFPQDASAMGVASVAKTKPVKQAKFMIDDFSMSEMPLDVIQTSEEMLEDQLDMIARIANEGKFLTKKQRALAEEYGIVYGQELFDSENRKEIEKQNLDKTAGSKIDMNEVTNKVLGYDKKKDAKSFVEQMKKKDPTEDPKIIIDDNLDGENLEDSFESEFEKQYKRLQKYLGADKDEQKGRLALALSDAVGTPGTLADKAAVLNKALLGIATQKKKDKKEIAKLAFAAATDLEGKRITAGKKTSAQQLIDRYVALKGKDKRTKDEELELKALEADLKITKDDTLSISGALNYSTALDTLKKNLEQVFDKNLTDETEKRILRNRIKSIIAGLRKAGIADATIQKDLTDYPGALEFFSQGGRVNMANGGATDAPAAPVDTKLNFEQLRTRLPQEITDDIIRLIANNEEALQDFSFIRTQGDVSKFNVKYGVNLVLPQDTV